MPHLPTAGVALSAGPSVRVHRELQGLLSRAARDLQRKKDRELQQRPGSHATHNRVTSRLSSPGLVSHSNPAEHEPKRRKLDATHKQQGLSAHHSTASPPEAPQPESSADDGVAARRPRPPKANGYVTANSSQHRNTLLTALKTLRIPPPAEESADETPASPALTRSGRPSQQQQQKHRRRDSAEGDLPKSVPTHVPSHTSTAKPAKAADQQPLRESRHASAVNGPQVGGISHPAPAFPNKNQSRKRQRPENIEGGGDACEPHGSHQQPLHAHLRQGQQPRSKLFPASLNAKSVSSRSHDWPPVGPSSLPRMMSKPVVRKAHTSVLQHATDGTTSGQQEGNIRNRNHITAAASNAHQQAPSAAPTKALHKQTLPSAGKHFLSKHRVSSPPPSETAAARQQRPHTNADRKQQFLHAHPTSILRTNPPSTRSTKKHVPNHRGAHNPHHSGLPRSTSLSPAHRGVMVSPLKKRRGKMASVLVRHGACKVSHGLTKSLLADAALRAAGHHGRRIQKH